MVPWVLTGIAAIAGTISGTVTLKGGTSGPVIVYVEGQGPAAPAYPLGAGNGEQRNKRFVRHGLVVSGETTVDFPNSDNIYHNVYFHNGDVLVDLGLYEGGKSASYTFSEPGEYDIRCNEHAWMWMSILVIPNGWFAAPAADGTYRIDGVTRGPHEVTAWTPDHERITARLNVTDGRVEQHFQLVREPADMPEVDKHGVPYIYAQ